MKYIMQILQACTHKLNMCEKQKKGEGTDLNKTAGLLIEGVFSKVETSTEGWVIKTEHIRVDDVLLSLSLGGA